MANGYGIGWVLFGWAGVGRSRADSLLGSGHRQSLGRGGGGEEEREGKGERGEERARGDHFKPVILSLDYMVGSSTS